MDVGFYDIRFTLWPLLKCVYGIRLMLAGGSGQKGALCGSLVWSMHVAWGIDFWPVAHPLPGSVHGGARQVGSWRYDVLMWEFPKNWGPISRFHVRSNAVCRKVPT